MPERCEYAPAGHDRCPPAICDCFIDTHPDDPFGLHPEAFLVNGHQYDINGHAATCPGEHDGCDCAELCSMGPTCPAGMLAEVPSSGCWRTTPPPTPTAHDERNTDG